MCMFIYLNVHDAYIFSFMYVYNCNKNEKQSLLHQRQKINKKICIHNNNNKKINTKTI